MHGMIVVAILAAGTLSSFTDWLFMGVLFHDRYNRHPEVWWPRGGNNTATILYSSIVGYLTSAGVVMLCAITNASTMMEAMTVALLAWIAGPLVVTVTNGMWIKIDPRVTFAHALGYLARFVLAAAAAALVLR